MYFFLFKACYLFQKRAKKEVGPRNLGLFECSFKHLRPGKREEETERDMIILEVKRSVVSFLYTKKKNAGSCSTTLVLVHHDEKTMITKYV